MSEVLDDGIDESLILFATAPCRRVAARLGRPREAVLQRSAPARGIDDADRGASRRATNETSPAVRCNAPETVAVDHDDAACCKPCSFCRLTNTTEISS